MSILTTEQYLADADCPELIDMANLPDRLIDIVEDGSWDKYNADMEVIADALGVSVERAMVMDMHGEIEYA